MRARARNRSSNDTYGMRFTVCVYKRQLLLVTFLIFLKNLSILFQKATKHMTKKTKKVRTKITKLNQSDRIVCKASSPKTEVDEKKIILTVTLAQEDKETVDKKREKRGVGGGKLTGLKNVDPRTIESRDAREEAPVVLRSLLLTLLKIRETSRSRRSRDASQSQQWIIMRHKGEQRQKGTEDRWDCVNEGGRVKRWRRGEREKKIETTLRNCLRGESLHEYVAGSPVSSGASARTALKAFREIIPGGSYEEKLRKRGPHSEYTREHVVPRRGRGGEGGHKAIDTSKVSPGLDSGDYRRGKFSRYSGISAKNINVVISILYYRVDPM